MQGLTKNKSKKMERGLCRATTHGKGHFAPLCQAQTHGKGANLGTWHHPVVAADAFAVRERGTAHGKEAGVAVREPGSADGKEFAVAVRVRAGLTAKGCTQQMICRSAKTDRTAASNGARQTLCRAKLTGCTTKPPLPALSLPSGLCQAGSHGKGFAVRISPFAVQNGCTAKPCFPVVNNGTLQQKTWTDLPE